MSAYRLSRGSCGSGVRDAEVGGGAAGAAVGVVPFGAEELEGEVEPFNLTGPTFGLGADFAGDEVGFEVVKPTSQASGASCVG